MWILRLFVVVIVLVGVGAWLSGYFGGPTWRTLAGEERIDNTSEAVERARQRSAELGQKAAIATSKAGESLNEAALTAKIKAKMALDDTVKALDLNVDTVDAVVTVTGKVRTKAEHERALALARETNGVKKVVDKMTIEAAR
jgi:hyperosmotically inducible protein